MGRVIGIHRVGHGSKKVNSIATDLGLDKLAIEYKDRRVELYRPRQEIEAWNRSSNLAILVRDIIQLVPNISRTRLRRTPTDLLSTLLVTDDWT